MVGVCQRPSRPIPGIRSASAALASLSPSDYPNTVQAADQMADYASDRHYALVLDQRLIGIGLASSQAP